MIFLFEERRSCVRSDVHRVTHDSDPDFAEACGEPHAMLIVSVRVWSARLEGGEAVPSAYLGQATIRDGRASRRDLLSLLRRTTEQALKDRRPSRAARRRLAALLREIARRRGAALERRRNITKIGLG